ncbi:MAG: bile acid:sodium symporter [Bacteroidales bacterium]|nr:bile acid:sodium symporter [Bacteroidales bacterium]MCM1146781.1 bile acid:sodium symporter [Bacteroidales bacterium]MCM1205722.1 bile acid:sodium symporter [Bacillota bacterium]MCM1510748.1 bile acid:sodium symporter [Clostridium sp.]
MKHLRSFKLPIAMITGVLAYYAFRALPLGPEGEKTLYAAITRAIQPMLIFVMLFLSFLRVSPHDLKPHRWHGMLLLTQGSLFVLCSLAACACGTLLRADCSAEMKILLEGAMLCFICPTATASAVIVRKLGGSMSGIVTYILLCNMMVSILAPAFLTLVEPHSGMDFFTELFLIMGQVFPLLLCPLFLAIVMRHYCRELTKKLLSVPDLPFYLWLVALPLAITVTVRTIYNSHISMSLLLWLSLVSLVACVLQFVLGRRIGRRWPQPVKDPAGRKIAVYAPATYVSEKERSAITAGQAFGQKNTVFVIWLGLMFLNPVTSVVGGCYSIWHNIINSWQLWKHNG